ncbi:peptidoglycan-binding protein [Thiohalobacter thiocyanaticus]|uniref:Peptidoglycan-binding protein n=1 Tax=Thiohalobacter thiocyanaticus TaxID=585455 RepID=A0A1Z4VS01_9GAMM|nr:peptidoglycan-binding protein [Thiohalobacter thiocyanaticus]
MSEPFFLNILRRLFAYALLLTAWPAAAAGPDSVDLRNGIEHFVTRAETQMTCRGLDWEALQRFYSQRGYLPVWWDIFERRPVPAAKQLIAILEQSPEHGLSVSDYHLHELMALLPSRPEADLVQIDVLLTDAFLAYARHLYSGRNRPQLIDPAWHIEPDSLDAEALLARVLDNTRLEATLAALAPPHPEYRQLQDLLVRYRGLAASGGWPALEPGPLLRPGARDLRVATLRQRLWLEGFPVDWEGDEYLFDSHLEQTLKRFQQLRGIEPDGIVGPDTLQALNVTATERIQQILLNLERWRWLPHDLGTRHIMVNIAGFRLQLVEHDQVTQDMRVIIGKPYRSTPAFVGRMSYLVFNPYWNVPERNMREDLLPQQIADPGYLAANGYRILEGWSPEAREIDPAEIDWQRVRPAQFPYRLRQDPGPQNSLGRIKFMLPNRFDVYLHDTPARHLFERTVRTFSSGCIRVEEPVALAERVLAGTEEDWSADAIREVIASRETRSIRLPEPLPVYVLYWTVWVDDEGRAHFVNDVYGRDRRMAQWLGTQAESESEAAVQ